LDTATGAAMLKLITELAHGKGIAAVVTTHDPSLMEVADTVVELRDGRMV
jgi:putative ABC transport system ATP-binding protein